MGQLLTSSFYERSTRQVARDLLGKTLVRVWRGKRLEGIIVETEAYLGIRDKAAHTYGGRRTKRNEAMYGPAGHAYVYFIYGMYHCINVVTQKAGVPEAVLIRALEVPLSLPKDANGPGKLCRTLKIDRDLNGQSFMGPTLFIEDHKGPKNRKVVSTVRVGIDYAEEAVMWPLRFYLEGNPCVSKR